MQLLSFTFNGQPSFGVIRDGGVVDLGIRMIGMHTLRAVLAGGGLDQVTDLASSHSSDYGLDEIRFRPPITDPEKIVCVGVNYGNRNAEYKDGSDAPRYPSLFMRTRESLVGHLQPMLRPPESEQLDYEGEIVIVIGKEGRRIPQDRAREHIAGLTLMNEGSIRDWLRHAKFNVTQGKNFEKSGSLGPYLVTVDEFESFDDLHLTTRVNGELRQDDTTANLMFSFDYLIAYVSTFMRLKPGDLLSTGTPVGAGARFDPPRYLQPGDQVEVAVEGIGTLVNPIEDEKL